MPVTVAVAEAVAEAVGIVSGRASGSQWEPVRASGSQWKSRPHDAHAPAQYHLGLMLSLKFLETD